MLANACGQQPPARADEREHHHITICHHHVAPTRPGSAHLVAITLKPRQRVARVLVHRAQQHLLFGVPSVVLQAALGHRKRVVLRDGDEARVARDVVGRRVRARLQVGAAGVRRHLAVVRRLVVRGLGARRAVVLQVRRRAVEGGLALPVRAPLAPSRVAGLPRWVRVRVTRCRWPVQLHLRQRMALQRWTNPNPIVVRVALSTGYHCVEGNRRASRHGRVSDLPPEIL
jgi:hypothetical protein